MHTVQRWPKRPCRPFITVTCGGAFHSHCCRLHQSERRWWSAEQRWPLFSEKPSHRDDLITSPYSSIINQLQPYRWAFERLLHISREHAKIKKKKKILQCRCIVFVALFFTLCSCFPHIMKSSLYLGCWLENSLTGVHAHVWPCFIFVY